MISSIKFNQVNSHVKSNIFDDHDLPSHLYQNLKIIDKSSLNDLKTISKHNNNSNSLIMYLEQYKNHMKKSSIQANLQLETFFKNLYANDNLAIRNKTLDEPSGILSENSQNIPNNTNKKTFFENSNKQTNIENEKNLKNLISPLKKNPILTQKRLNLSVEKENNPQTQEENNIDQAEVKSISKLRQRKSDPNLIKEMKLQKDFLEADKTKNNIDDDILKQRENQALQNFIENSQPSNTNSDYVVLSRAQFNNQYIEKNTHLAWKNQITSNILTFQNHLQELKNYQNNFHAELITYLTNYQTKIKNILEENLQKLCQKIKEDNKNNLLKAKLQTSKLKQDFINFQTSIQNHLEQEYSNISNLFSNQLKSHYKQHILTAQSHNEILDSIQLTEHTNKNQSLLSPSKFSTPLKDFSFSMQTPAKHFTSGFSHGDDGDSNIHLKGKIGESGMSIRSHKPKRVNAAISEGLMYLLQNDAISGAKDEESKKLIEDRIKSKSPLKLTTDFVIENLMDKTRKKVLNYKELAGVEVKKKRKTPVSEAKNSKIIPNNTQNIHIIPEVSEEYSDDNGHYCLRIFNPAGYEIQPNKENRCSNRKNKRY